MSGNVPPILRPPASRPSPRSPRAGGVGRGARHGRLETRAASRKPARNTRFTKGHTKRAMARHCRRSLARCRPSRALLRQRARGGQFRASGLARPARPRRARGAPGAASARKVTCMNRPSRVPSAQPGRRSVGAVPCTGRSVCRIPSQFLTFTVIKCRRHANGSSHTALMLSAKLTKSPNLFICQKGG